MTLTSRIVFVALPLAMTSWLQAQVRMHAGLWENTVKANGQSATRNACITAEQEQKSSGTVASMRESLEKTLAKTGCKVKEFTIVGSTQTIVTVCGTSTTKTVTAYHTDSFESTSTTTTPEGVTTSSGKGRRIGDCPPGGAK